MNSTDWMMLSLGAAAGAVALTLISMAARGSRKAGTPTSMKPPAYGRLSKTVTW